MDIRIYSIYTNSQAGNMTVYIDYNDNTKRPKLQDTQQESQIFTPFDGKFSRGAWVQEKALLGLPISL